MRSRRIVSAAAPSLPDELAYPPIAVVGHGDRERLDLFDIRMIAGEGVFLTVCPCDLSGWRQPLPWRELGLPCVPLTEPAHGDGDGHGLARRVLLCHLDAADAARIVGLVPANV